MSLTALLIVARAAHIGASILVAGIFTFEVVILDLDGSRVSDRLREVERRLFRLAVWGVAVAFLSALLWFWLEVVHMSGLALAASFSTAAWRTVLFQTGFGRVWQFRLGLIAVAFLLIASGLMRGKMRRVLMLNLWLLSIVFLVSLAWISHAAAAQVQPLGVCGDALHLGAAGGWIGGLVPLAIFLTRAPVSFSLGEGIAMVLRRFSALSLCCVCVLIVSGICNSWLLVGSIHALFATPYGWLLLCKLTFFSVLIGFGARNRLAIKTKLLRAQTGLDLLAQLRRNVICEACLGTAVVAMVACLGVTPPAIRTILSAVRP